MRGLLHSALGDEPPIGPVAHNSLRAGIRLRRRARIRRAAGGAAVIVAAAVAIPAVTGRLGTTAAAPRTGSAREATAYVVNGQSGGVTPIDLATNRRGKPINAGEAPYAIAITPDGKTACVAAGNAVTPIDLATSTSGKPIRVWHFSAYRYMGSPGSIAIMP